MTHPAPLATFEVDGRTIAYRRQDGAGPALMFLPGYASDMEGSKALALAEHAARHGRACLRFDYSGTGSSAGRFEDGTLDRWLEESLAAFDRLTDGPVVVIGSSMGGWLGLHLAARRLERVAALVLVAGAPDFTEWGFADKYKAQLSQGIDLWRAPPSGGDERVTTAAFWQSGQALRLLEAPIAVDCPVRLVHGDRDTDVPLEIALRTFDRLRSADVQLNILKGGGHRLSEPHEIAAILRAVDGLLEP